MKSLYLIKTRGINQRLAEAVAAALANGVTAAELEAALKTSATDLASAIVEENTPAANLPA